MNVAFPGHGTAADFWIIVAAMVGVLAGVLTFFRLKRFF
jgi:Mg2+ and Co2+ transporter CorA